MTPEAEPRLQTRRPFDESAIVHPNSPHAVAATLPPAPPQSRRRSFWRNPQRLLRAATTTLLVLALLGIAGWFAAQYWMHATTRAALPQLDGSLTLAGLTAPVTVQRDAHGVPHIHAQTIDDLLLAQGFTTAADRLFQMDMLRRHAAGELAEVYGTPLVAHDRVQRTLQIRAAADRAIAQLPADQLHLLEIYARGVNASMAAQSAHLPIEFHLLHYEPAPWTPRDSLLVSLAMFQDLTNSYPTKLSRETLTARLPVELVADLYPVGSWRDHPPANPIPDLTIQGPPVEQVPLDESQSSLTPEHEPNSAPFIAPLSLAMSGSTPNPEEATCPDCTPGSNNWVVSGAHTASGKPLLSNDMHLNHTLPGIWYEADLQAAESNLHVAGVSIPGLPLIVVGHNEHVAWGFTNLGADVQDVYIETLRETGDSQEFQAVDGTWQPVVHLSEHIKVKRGLDVKLDLLATRHGDAITPLLPDKTRAISLRWTLYDPTVLQLPVLQIAKSHDWPSFLAGFAKFGGPSQNVVYADDQGHIGYHAVGRIPLRGPAVNAAAVALPDTIASPDTPVPDPNTPDMTAEPNPLGKTTLQTTGTPAAPYLSGPLSPVPLVPGTAHEWSGYIPFDQLPQVFDPPSGIIATANARVAPDDYRYPITLNWAAPYRVERIVHALAHRTGLRAEDMLALQTDVYSDFDHVLAQRLAYALDHSSALSSASKASAHQQKSLRQAADLLRTWNGRMTVESPAAAIVAAVHTGLWSMLLAPHLDPKAMTASTLYVWGERDYALEQVLMHTPPRWLPPAYANWDDLLAEAVNRALIETHAPADLNTWRYGNTHTVEVEHPLFEQSKILQRLLGRPAGTGAQPQSGDATTVKQVSHTFGPSERFTADLSNLDRSTLNLVLGQSGNAMSPWFLDQFPAWLKGTTFPLPFSLQAVNDSTIHTLTLRP